MYTWLLEVTESHSAPIEFWSESGPEKAALVGAQYGKGKLGPMKPAKAEEAQRLVPRSDNHQQPK
jgi:hypothetical protein